VHKKPRQVTVFYYCDFFQSMDAQIMEISEPDWCVYHVKIVSKYLCGRGDSFIIGD
jgi:hypothetical protein